MKHLVIIGGGFGGFYLAKKLDHQKKVKVTLIDCDEYFVYTPLLHEVAVGEIPEEAVKIPFKETLKNCSHIKAEVKKISFGQKKVFFNDESLSYDYLVIASGAVPRYGIKSGAMPPTLKTVQDASKIKKIMRTALQEPKCSIAVVGSGATGTELIGELATLSKHFNKQLNLHHFLYNEGYFTNFKGFDVRMKAR